MRSGPIAAVAVLLSLAPILSACGDEQTTAASTETTSSKAAATGRARAATSGLKTSDQAARQCRRSLGDFLDSTESLNNTLAVGLSYADYLRAVNHVRVTYASVQADDLPIACLARAASPAEQALNVYIAAANTWGNCLATTSCSPEEVEPKLQHEWAQASDLLSDAQSSLRALG